MYKKRYFIFFIFIFFILLPYGCKEVNNKKITITMVSGSVGKELETLKKQISMFEESHPDIMVELMESPESQNRKYKQYVDWLKNPDSGVDIYTIDIVWVAEFGEAGWLLPLNDYIGKNGIDLNDYLESNIKASKWNGDIIALPWFTSVGVLYYRKDLLDKYDCKVPVTWEELKDTSEKILEGEREENPQMAGFVFQADRSEALVTNYLEYLWGEGGSVISDDGEIIMDYDKALKALETYSEMVEISSPGIIAFQEEDARNYFQSGNSVFMRNWPYAWTLLNSRNSEVRGKFSIAPLPSGSEDLKGAAALGGWQLAISNYSKYPDEAFQLIAFLSSAEQQALKAMATGQNPTRKSCYKDEQVLKSNPSMAEIFEIVMEANPRPVHHRYSDISKIIQKEVHLTLEGKQDGHKAVENMLKAINAAVLDEEKN